MNKVKLSLGDLVVFRFNGEKGDVRIGVRGDGDYCDDIYYNGKVYHDSTITIVEYGRNDGTHSTLYDAVGKAYPRYVNLHPEDMVDYILHKDLKLNELAKVEREYNKILNNRKPSKTDLFSKRR